MGWEEDYRRLSDTFGYSIKKDSDARDLLLTLLPETPDWDELQEEIEGEVAYVFGAGPSLQIDIAVLKKHDLLTDALTVAADGAAGALIDARITPNIIVTDLDGPEETLIKANKRGAKFVVHAHSDNTENMKEIIPKIKPPIYPTTQVAPKEPARNYGGFTDGDRAVRITGELKAATIILAGMDFGEKIGTHSGQKDPAAKKKKLDYGKKLLEEYASKRRATILNVTAKGDPILGAPRIIPSALSTLLGVI
ncbi:6-hydroxymethyl-7,8-dihydropterin pyrophosphokinase [uncultured archaeon]|nr:6-hydroxymethyl-7,8-dihydropterin pyrophosphokinase [uncultured archaeon]